MRMKITLAPGCLAILGCCAAFGQSAAAPPAFDVADVSVSQTTGPPRGHFSPGGRLDVRNVSLRLLITQAYDITNDMLKGGPAWLDSAGYDIVAKARPDTPYATLRVMLQTLLAERFKLAVHREDKVMNVYALVVGKRGIKLQPGVDTGQPNCDSRAVEGRIHRDCQNMTMAELAKRLPGMAPAYVDAPVVDLTEIKGACGFALEWVPRGLNQPADAGRGADAAAADVAGPTIFEAVEQLGLKLESRKHPMPVIVIDHIERVPAEN